MNKEDIAKALAAARVSGEYAAVDVTAIDQAEAAEDILAAAVVLYGGRRIGYKIGSTSEAAQKATGAPGPWFAPMVESDLSRDGTTLVWKKHYRGVECEFAFRIGETYPMFDTKPNPASLRQAVTACHLALEVAGRRTEGEGLTRYPAVLADFGAHCAFVLGPQVKNWDSQDLAEVAVSGLRDGVVTNKGSGAAVMGGPLNSLLWLTERLAEQGLQLQEGDWVLTGTTMGIVVPEPGSTVTGDFGELGKVSVNFARES
ncbi:2-keto-4-pentenoate hydratase [Rhodopseudomonas julia]|uniref:2-keto-4-pentenoate hydratase n=1 Tax=Rhodopseudomonas julia TaxID=200617 RepID=A0ABU0C525_9BRAD|nr:fumarylacetoacetate hydrolase family protein [Rhodopseudomonas julia]MDQ0324770.1 2-keto-4-pentenoate hydratase [Rhodopseudomonas julia]